MARTAITEVSANNTFQVWLEKTNELVSLMSSDVLTASLVSSNGDLTIGNATLQGIFTANTVIVQDILSVDIITPKSGSTAVQVNSPVNIVTNQTVLERLSSTSGPRLSLSNTTDTDWQIGFENNTTKNFVISNGSNVFRLSGSGNLELTGILSGTAQTANTVSLIATNTTNSTHYPLFANTATGNAQVRSDTGFTYNPNTGVLSSSTFSGNLTGNVTGNVTGNLNGSVSGNVTGNVSGNLTGNVTGNVTGNLTVPSSGSLDASNAGTIQLPPGFGIVPSGGIIMWSGAATAIPTGWRLCNGANGTPDLRDRFVVGAGGSYTVGATGGANSVTLSVNEMPTHGHTFSGTTSVEGSHVHQEQYYETNGSGDGNFGPGASCCGGAVKSTNGVFTLPAGAHSHTFSGTTTANGNGLPHENRPPYYALCFIMKI